MLRWPRNSKPLSCVIMVLLCATCDKWRRLANEKENITALSYVARRRCGWVSLEKIRSEAHVTVMNHIAEKEDEILWATFLSQTVWRNWLPKLRSLLKERHTTAITRLKVIKGTNSLSVPMESPYTTSFLWLIFPSTTSDIFLYPCAPHFLKVGYAHPSSYGGAVPA